MTIDQLITQVGTQHVIAFFLVLGRVGPLFVFAPFFGSKLVPARVRGIAAVALAIGISPVVARHTTLPLGTSDIAWLLAKEILVGFSFAFTLGALTAALQTAGALLDVSIGFSFGGLVDPVNGNQSGPLAAAYGLIGTLVFIAIGGDAWVVQGLARTYDVVGLGESPSLGRLVAGADAAFASITTAAIEVAGPVMLAILLTDAAFGVVSRVVPQLNVFAVGFPAKIVVGFLLIGATLPFLTGWITGQLQQDVGAALTALRVG